MKKIFVASLFFTCSFYPANAIDIIPPISTFTINGHTYTNEMWEANFQGTLSAVAADIAAVASAFGGSSVPTNAGLKAVAPGSSTYMIRQGFYAAGDGGYARYVWSGSPCSLNGGLGDNGSQVDPDTGTGCWLADFSNQIPTPLVWGAVGNGTTNDNVPVQAAVTAMGLSGRGAVLNLGNRQYCITSITISSPLRIIGTGTTTGGDPNAGFVACTANTNLITINTNGTELEGFGIKASFVGTTTGTSIVVNGSHNKISFLQFKQPCIGIQDLGESNSYILNYFYGNEARAISSGCAGIIVGNNAIHSKNTIIIGNKIVLSGTNTEGAGPGWAYGIRVRNSGQAYLSGNSIFYPYIGTVLNPQSGELVWGTQLVGTGLGDSTYSHGFIIYPGDGGIVHTTTVTGSWVGNAGNWNTAGVWTPANGYLIGLDGTTGSVRGVTVSGSWLNAASHAGLLVADNVREISINNNWLCGAGWSINATYSGIRTAGNDVKITGNTIGKTCGGLASPSDLIAGVVVESNNMAGGLTITDNQIGGFGGNNGIVIEGSGFIYNSIAAAIENNTGVDNVITTVALSGGNLYAPPNPAFFVSGSGTLGNMYGAWDSRTVTMISTDGGVNVVTGGGPGSAFCNTITLSANNAYTAHYASGCWRIVN